MRSGFFNSNITGYDEVNNPIYDRAEEASFFAEFFAAFIGNGVYPNPSTGMQVVENSSLGVLVKPGKCFINGYFGLVEPGGEELVFEASDSNLSRIDRIVARWDLMNRDINLHVLKGVPASNPVATALTRNSNVYELGIADVKIAKGATVITQAGITDTRLNRNLCGIVSGVIEQVDTTTLFEQYLSWFEEIKQDSKNDYQSWFNGFTIPSEAQFKAWFDNIKDQLSGDVAGNLQNEIDALMADVAVNKDTIEQNSRDIELNAENITKNSKDIAGKMNKSGGEFTGTIKTQSIVPAKDRTLDLGSEASLWHRAYINQLIMTYTKLYEVGTASIVGVYEQLTARAPWNHDIWRPMSASAFNVNSSKRYKENIRELTEEEANKIDELETKVFDYKIKENGINVTGLIAEDVYKIFPDVVTLTKLNGKKVPDSIDYSKLVTPLIKKVQMQGDLIAKLQQDVAELKKEVKGG